ncbi:MAG TPA: hypothetical protein VJV79_20870 [Polyangiaceae bacterium]|nr:hypothetical protein [Polyangiaceae bacterium]
MRTDRSGLAACRLFAIGIGLSASLLTGCPGTLDDKQRFLAAAGAGGVSVADDAGADADAGPDLGPCGDVVARIFVPSCSGTGCHDATGPQQDLDLVSPGVAARVVGVSGIGCPSILADPANPEASLLYQKLLPTPPCGSPMPLARPILSDEDIACVLTWIAAQQ